MRKTHAYVIGGVWVLAVAVGALALRMPGLDQKVMHTDEAVQAVKFGDLLDNGRYVYDPVEYHGPTLYYFTLPVAKWTGVTRFADATEWTIRLVPVAFGVGLVLLLWLVMDGLSAPAVAFAAVLTAVSHAMVFYSRYYIQEMLLVFFTFGLLAFGWRCARAQSGTARAVWASLAGVCAGLAHATKETFILAVASMAAALGLMLLWRRVAGAIRRPPDPAPDKSAVRWRLPLAIAVGAMVIVSVLFFSSFFTHARGPWDSVATYANYFTKASHNEVHDKPWDYYLRVLACYQDKPLPHLATWGEFWTFARRVLAVPREGRQPRDPVWTEGLILLLAAVGLVFALLGRGLGRGSRWLARFLAFHAVLLTAAYSLIPYKTPWCLLSFLHGMILLAGIGAAGLLRMLTFGRRWPVVSLSACLRAVLVAGLAYGTIHLGAQARRGVSPAFRSDLRNPYVYAHTLKNLLELPQFLDKLRKLHPKGRSLTIQVVAPNYYPLPWYLRKYPRVGWWKHLPPREQLCTPIVIVGQPDEEDAHSAYAYPNPDDTNDPIPLWKVLLEHYENGGTYGLRRRPEVFMSMYVRKDLWAEFVKSVANHHAPAPPRGTKSKPQDKPWPWTLIGLTAMLAGAYFALGACAVRREEAPDARANDTLPPPPAA